MSFSTTSLRAARRKKGGILAALGRVLRAVGAMIKHIVFVPESERVQASALSTTRRKTVRAKRPRALAGKRLAAAAGK